MSSPWSDVRLALEVMFEGVEGSGHLPVLTSSPSREGGSGGGSSSKVRVTHTRGSQGVLRGLDRRVLALHDSCCEACTEATMQLLHNMSFDSASPSPPISITAAVNEKAPDLSLGMNVFDAAPIVFLCCYLGA